MAVHEFSRRGGWWVAGQIGLFGAYAWALGYGRGVPIGLAALGWLLAAAGAGLGIGGLTALGSNLTPYPQPLDHGRLVEHGVYRAVRHPIYGGVICGAIGLALARGSWPALALALAILVFFWLKAGREERRLAASYPDYGAYQARVRARLVPWIL